jgi:type IV secretion system protein VirD4
MLLLGGTLIASALIFALLTDKNPKLVGTIQDDTYKKDIADVLYSLSDANKICGSRELRTLTGQGIQCSRNVRLSIKQSNEHILMISPTGGGKSTRLFKPNTKLLNQNNCSIVITDPCNEIEKSYKGDKKTYILNPFRDETIGYDPLKNCSSEFEVRKMAKVILLNGNQSSRKGTATNQTDWIEMATPLFTAYLLYCYYCKRYNFSEVIQNICTLPIGYIEAEIMGDDFESPKIEFISFTKVTDAKQTLSSIRSVLNSCLQVFLDSNIKKMFTKNSIDFSRIRKEESILFIQIPERHSEYYAPLSAVLMSQLFDIMLDNDGLQTYMMFDEFCNIGIIPDIAKILSTARKHKLSIIAAIQSLMQLAVMYGDKEAEELHELFKTILITSGLKESADYISKLLGTQDRKIDGIFKTEPLMSADELRRMNSNEVLIICNNKRPVIDYMIDFAA